MVADFPVACERYRLIFIAKVLEKANRIQDDFVDKETNDAPYKGKQRDVKDAMVHGPGKRPDNVVCVSLQ
jgi:hypothetical protein